MRVESRNLRDMGARVEELLGRARALGGESPTALPRILTAEAFALDDVDERALQLTERALGLARLNSQGESSAVVSVDRVIVLVFRARGQRTMLRVASTINVKLRRVCVAGNFPFKSRPRGPSRGTSRGAWS